MSSATFSFHRWSYKTWTLSFIELVFVRMKSVCLDAVHSLRSKKTIENLKSWAYFIWLAKFAILFIAMCFACLTICVRFKKDIDFLLLDKKFISQWSCWRSATRYEKRSWKFCMTKINDWSIRAFILIEILHHWWRCSWSITVFIFVTSFSFITIATVETRSRKRFKSSTYWWNELRLIACEAYTKVSSNAWSMIEKQWTTA